MSQRPLPHLPEHSHCLTSFSRLSWLPSFSFVLLPVEILVSVGLPVLSSPGPYQSLKHRVDGAGHATVPLGRCELDSFVPPLPLLEAVLSI